MLRPRRLEAGRAAEEECTVQADRAPPQPPAKLGVTPREAYEASLLNALGLPLTLLPGPLCKPKRSLVLVLTPSCLRGCVIRTARSDGEVRSGLGKHLHHRDVPSSGSYVQSRGAVPVALVDRCSAFEQHPREVSLVAPAGAGIDQRRRAFWACVGGVHQCAAI